MFCNKKCIKFRHEQVKNVAKHDVQLQKVQGLIEKALVGRFMGKFFNRKILKKWLLEH